TSSCLEIFAHPGLALHQFFFCLLNDGPQKQLALMVIIIESKAPRSRARAAHFFKLLGFGHPPISEPILDFAHSKGPIVSRTTCLAHSTRLRLSDNSSSASMPQYQRPSWK